jgi:ribosomal protein S19
MKRINARNMIINLKYLMKYFKIQNGKKFSRIKIFYLEKI